MSSSMENSHGRAPHACSSCKKQKRRCDKVLPECSLCRRVGRTCDYSENQLPTPDSLVALQSRIVELEARLSQGSSGESPHSTSSSSNISRNSHSAQVIATNPFERFPSIFFLDHDIFNEARLKVPRPMLSIPDEIYNILGSVDDLRLIADRYFSTVHQWLPIVSKKRIQLALTAAELEMHSDCALLLAAMRMISDDKVKSRSSADSHMYRIVKTQYSCLEASAMMTPQLLQTAVLIAAYEIGHAIYPSAYLSVGRCVTLGKAIGLDNRRHAPQMFRRYGAWAEMEEIRRTWWAVLLLDRYVHISSKGHSLGTDEPSRTDVLPADDEHFDLGEMIGSEPLYVASPTAVHAGPFTRTLQAAHLLGKTVNAMNEYYHESETRFMTLIQLHKTLTAFHKVAKEDFVRLPNAYSTALALTNSALLHVSDPFCCSTTLNSGSHTAEEVEMQTMCIASITAIAWEVLSWFQQIRASMLSDPASISPLVGDALYLGLVAFSWMVYEKNSPELVAAYKTLREAMSLFKMRWASGGEYLDAVDKGKEILYDNSPLL